MDVNAFQARKRSVNDYPNAYSLREALASPPQDLSVSKSVPDAETSEVHRGENAALVSLEGNDAPPCEVVMESSSRNGFSEKQDWYVPNIDVDSSHQQQVSREVQRLQELKSYMVIQSARRHVDTKSDQFERVSRMGNKMFPGCQCLITFVDMGCVFYLAPNYGVVGRLPRGSTFCAHCVLSKEEVFVVKDASKDSRFKHSPSVTGGQQILFYAGTSIVTPEGQNLGTVCIVDKQPRPEGLNDQQKEDLIDLAKWTMQVLIDRRKLHQQQNQLEKASQMLVSASHDLLTPLTGVQLSLSMLNRSSVEETLPEHMQEYLKTATRCTDVLGQICESLRAKNAGSDTCSSSKASPATKPQPSVWSSREQTYSNYKSFQIAELMNRAQQVAVALPKQVPLTVNVDDDLCPEVWGDELTVFRGVLALLGTAFERTIQGSVQMIVRMQHVMGCRPRIVFECEDSGPTIDAEQTKLLTGKQKMVCNTDYDEENFLDLPLDSDCLGSAHADYLKGFSITSLFSMSSQVRAAGGEFGVTSLDVSRNNGGNSPSNPTTRFWFSLPVDLPAEQCPKQKEMRQKHAEISASKDSPCSVAPGQKKQALVIDDSVIVRKTMARALSALGYKAAVAVNGLEGLTEMQNAPFDLVLCDFLMPVMDGLDCVREYRRWEKKHRPGFHQVIVGMSAHASGKDVDRGLSLGMDAYRSKPVSLEHLKQLQQIAHLLAISGTVDRIDTEVHNEINTLDGVHSIERLQNGLNESFDKLDKRSEKVCMIASDQPSISTIKKILSAQSWKTVYVSNGEDALCLLKTRNWGAVLIDSELEGLSSIPRITEFRKWEQNNRIHRQNNVLLMHNCYLSPSPETSRQSLVNLPSGIDGAIRKPVNKEEIERVLRTAEEAPLDATAIVTRC